MSCQWDLTAASTSVSWSDSQLEKPNLCISWVQPQHSDKRKKMKIVGGFSEHHLENPFSNTWTPETKENREKEDTTCAY